MLAGLAVPDKVATLFAEPQKVLSVSSADGSVIPAREKREGQNPTRTGPPEVTPLQIPPWGGSAPSEGMSQPPRHKAGACVRVRVRVCMCSVLQYGTAECAPDAGERAVNRPAAPSLTGLPPQYRCYRRNEAGQCGLELVVGIAILSRSQGSLPERVTFSVGT